MLWSLPPGPLDAKHIGQLRLHRSVNSTKPIQVCCSCSSHNPQSCGTAFRRRLGRTYQRQDGRGVAFFAIPPCRIAADKVFASSVLGASLAKVDTFAARDNFRWHNFHAFRAQGVGRPDHHVVSPRSRIEGRLSGFRNSGFRWIHSSSLLIEFS